MDLTVMTKTFLGLVLLSAGFGTGCSSSDGAAQPSLQGLWQTTVSGNCVGVYNFNGAVFADDLACPLESGNYGLEIESGDFSTTATQIDFTPRKSSCPPHSAGGYTVDYAIQGTQLNLLFPGASLVLERTSAMPSSMGSAAVNGCWDLTVTPGKFTPGPIVDL